MQTSEITGFLMIGQSNMAGRGDFNEVAPICNDDCLMLRMGRWQPMTEPINPDRDIFNPKWHSGVNLCASFADRYAGHFGKKAGLIPCADGDTALSQWMPGEILFDHAVLMTRLAMRTSSLGGILWHQGENDCSEEGVFTYKDKFLSMMREMRSALGAENVPILIGELSETISPEWELGSYPKELNAVFQKIEKELPLCRVVSAKGLTLRKDGIHFDSKSLRELGRRYFEAYLQLAAAKNI